MFDPRTRKRARRHRQRINNKKVQLHFNWFLSFIMLWLWGSLGFILLNVEPGLIRDIPFANWYGPFFGLLFLCLLATARLLTGNRKRALIISLAITGFLVLRINHLGQWYNAGLLLALALSVDYLWLGPWDLSRLKFRFKKDVVKSEHESE